MATYTKKIALNTLVQIIGKAVTTAVSVVMLAYLARYLSVSGYGEYTTVFAFLGFFAILADMGFYTMAVREVAKNPEKSSYIIGNIFSLRILFAIIFLFFAPIVGSLIPAYSESIKIGIWIGSLSSFFVLANQIYVGIFQANFRMDKLVISDVAGRIFLLIATLIFINLKMSLQFFIFGSVLANFISFILSYSMSRKFLHFSPQFDFSYWKHIIKESLPLGIVIVLGLIYFKIDTIMLSIMKDSTAVGIYGAPYKILEILITIPAMFMGSVFPLASKYFKERDSRFKDSFHNSFDFMAMIVLPIMVGTFLLAKPIVVLVLGQEFISSALVLQILIFAVFIIFFGTIMGNFVVVSNLQRKLVIVYILSVFVNIAGNLLLIPHYSYLGCSVVTIFTESLVCALAYIMVYRYLHLVPRFYIFFKSLVAALIMGIFIYYFSYLNLFMIIIFGGIIYFAVLYIIGGIRRDILVKLLK